MTLDQQKQRFRGQAQLQRQRITASAGLNGPTQLAEHFIQALFPLPDDSIVSGYLAIGDELTVEPLLERILRTGHRVALPVVDLPNAPLFFRNWAPGAPLENGPFKTRHPLNTEPELKPDILLVPMLAFDRQGQRMGWGGGYYDRTLEALRKNKSVLAVGIAFEGQRVDAVPCGPYDQPLDWVVTELAAHKIDK